MLSPQCSDHLAHQWMSNQGFSELQVPALSTLLMKGKFRLTSLGLFPAPLEQDLRQALAFTLQKDHLTLL